MSRRRQSPQLRILLDIHPTVQRIDKNGDVEDDQAKGRIDIALADKVELGVELSQTWITCDGGPLIVMEKRLLPFWEGSDAPSNGRIVEAESRWGLDVATDYDRACDINDWSGVINVGDGFGLVVSIETHATSWIPSIGEASGDLVEWGFADSEFDVLKEHEKLATLDDLSTAKIFEIKSSPVVLFAAAEFGLESLYERLEFDLVPGRYRILSRESKNESTYIIGHQFKVEA